MRELQDYYLNWDFILHRASGGWHWWLRGQDKPRRPGLSASAHACYWPFSLHKLRVVFLFFEGFEASAHLVSLLPAEVDAVLDGEFVGGLAGAGQSGWVTAVSEAAQVSRHCGGGREGTRRGEERGH